MNKTIRFKVIRPVWETLTIKEELPEYLRKSRSITSSNDAFHLFKWLQQETKEYFIALHLDSKNKIICVDQVSTGGLNGTIVHPREVFKSCLLSSCAAILFVHNHPSLDTTPSAEDNLLTLRLRDAGKLLDIRVLDHVIIGERFYSYADAGML